MEHVKRLRSLLVKYDLLCYLIENYLYKFQVSVFDLFSH